MKRHYFDEEEKIRMGAELAEKVKLLESLKENKKEDMKIWNEKISDAQDEADMLAIKITNGFVEVGEDQLQAKLYPDI